LRGLPRRHGKADPGRALRQARGGRGAGRLPDDPGRRLRDGRGAAGGRRRHGDDWGASVLKERDAPTSPRGRGGGVTLLKPLRRSMIARQLALTLTALFTGAAGTSPSPS